MSAPRGTAAVEEHSPTTEPEVEGPLSTNCFLEEEAAVNNPTVEKEGEDIVTKPVGGKPPRPGAPTVKLF